jgi:hypothetical protein
MSMIACMHESMIRPVANEGLKTVTQYEHSESPTIIKNAWNPVGDMPEGGRHRTQTNGPLRSSDPGRYKWCHILLSCQRPSLTSTQHNCPSQWHRAVTTRSIMLFFRPSMLTWQAMASLSPVIVKMTRPLGRTTAPYACIINARHMLINVILVPGHQYWGPCDVF